MEDSLHTLVRCGVQVASVLDVGVFSGTAPLMSVFPHVPHYLFEPLDSHFESIRQAYWDIRHEIIHVALSDEDGQAWQVATCRDKTGQVTHSRLSDRPISAAEEPELVECRAIRKARLDTALTGISPSQPFLLKVDVDGHEIPVLRGATETLKKASVVVIEAPISTIVERAAVLEQNGFQLFDIVDLSYYYGTLFQVDLIFLRQDVINANDELRPWETKTFSWDAWTSLGHAYFGNRSSR